MAETIEVLLMVIRKNYGFFEVRFLIITKISDKNKGSAAVIMTIFENSANTNPSKSFEILFICVQNFVSPLGWV